MAGPSDVTLRVRLELEAEGDIHYDQAIQVVEQVCRDAMHGTFGEIAGLSAPTIKPKEVEQNDGTVTFKLTLPGEVLPGPTWILQHLIGIVAGDLVPSSVAGCRVTGEVLDLKLGEDLESTLIGTFRGTKANDADRLRERFGLSPEMPLLGYAFKPRAGTDYSTTRKVALAVLRAGFNYVVLDTRNTDVTKDTLNGWLHLIEEAASLDVDHITAFSPNLSMPTLDLLPIAERIMELDIREAPRVLKIDGGLDGMSAIQAVRREFGGAPVISTYPLLYLPRALPRDRFLYLLALSGADLGYPGGRPLLPNDVRPIRPEEERALSRSVETYEHVLERGWPTPLVAGGIHPGQLHALYELFGPQVGIFLGGGVATHAEGPAAGAELCAQIVREAAKAAVKAKNRGGVADPHVSEKLIKEVEESYGGIAYLPPDELFKETKLKRWYEG